MGALMTFCKVINIDFGKLFFTPIMTKKQGKIDNTHSTEP